MENSLKSYKKYHGSDVRNRRLTLLFIISFLLAVGIIRGERVALILAQTMLALMIVTYAYIHYVIHQITLSRVTLDRAVENDLVSVQINIRCFFWLPLRWICIKDYFGAEAHCERHHEYLITQFDLFCNSQKIQYVARCAMGRGKYKIGPMELALTDPLGIWIKSKEIPILHEILVLPSVVKLNSVSPGGRQQMTFNGSRKRQKVGLSSDFCGIREYRHGDNLRHIHWPATAKASKLIIREFEQITTSRITIVLDLYRKSLQGFRPTNLDYAIKIAASIGKYAVDNSYEFRILAQGKEIHNAPHGKNNAYMNWMLEKMALMKPVGEKNLLELLAEQTHLIKRGEEVIVIFSSHIGNSENYLHLLCALQKRNISVTAVFLTSISFKILQEYDGVDSYMLDNDLPKMCAAQGIHVVMLEKGADIARCFEGSF